MTAGDRGREWREIPACFRGEPSYFTTEVQPADGSVVALTPRYGDAVYYRPTGFAELTTIENRVTITALSVETEAAALDTPFPATFHLSLQPGHQPTAEIDLETGCGTVDVPLKIEYPFLWEGLRLGSPPRSTFGAGRGPLQADARCHLRYDMAEGGFTVALHAFVPTIPPATRTPVALSAFFSCRCFDGSRCLKTEISLKYSMKAENGYQHMFTWDKAQEMVDYAAKIWGCAKEGQACIVPRLHERMSATLPDPVIIAGVGLSKSEEGVLDTKHRSSPKMLDVYVVYDFDDKRSSRRVMGVAHPNPRGIILRRNGLDGKPRSWSDLFATFSHEFGHALGLAMRDPRGAYGRDPRGVDGHSTRITNVNSTTGDGGPGNELNQLQVDVARQSPLLVQRRATCKADPKEKP